MTIKIATFAVALATMLGLSTIADADSSGKSRTRIKADACHAAYAQLQSINPLDMGSGLGWDSKLAVVDNYAYLYVFTAEYCGD